MPESRLPAAQTPLGMEYEQNLSVHHRVVGNSTGQAKSVGFHLLMQMVQNVKANFLQAGL